MAAAASATATIRSTYYHPQHMLTSYHYTAASTHPCAACERVVTGAGYSCDECDFNIHKACFTGLPGSICLGRTQSDHGQGLLAFTLALTRLDAARACRLCEETSRAGRYMYLCAPLEVYRPAPPVRAAHGRHALPPRALAVHLLLRRRRRDLGLRSVRARHHRRRRLPLRRVRLQHPRGLPQPPRLHLLRQAQPRARPHAHPPQGQPLVRRLQGDLPRRMLHVSLRTVQLRRAPAVRAGGGRRRPAAAPARPGPA